MTGEEQDSVYPLPVFHFKVQIGSIAVITFKEVSGLDAEAQIIEYRNSKSQEFSKIKMPGIKKCNNIHFKKGLFLNDSKIVDWFNTVKTNTIEPEQITISLLDTEGNPTMVWKLNNAWPTKVIGVCLKEGNEADIEQLDVAYEGLVGSPVKFV